jgi:hypothetical protein
VTITICSIFIHVPVPAQNSDQLSAQTISSLQYYGEGENIGESKNNWAGKNKTTNEYNCENCICNLTHKGLKFNTFLVFLSSGNP